MNEESVMFRDELIQNELFEFCDFFSKHQISYSVFGDGEDDRYVGLRIKGCKFEFFDGKLVRGEL